MRKRTLKVATGVLRPPQDGNLWNSTGIPEEPGLAILDQTLPATSREDLLTDAWNFSRPLLALQYIQSGTLQDQQSFQGVIEAVRRSELSFVDAAQQCSKLNPAIALEWFMTYLHLAVTQDAAVQSNQNVYLFLDRLNHMHQMIVSGSTVNQQLLWEELLMSWGQVFSKR